MAATRMRPMHSRRVQFDSVDNIEAAVATRVVVPKIADFGMALRMHDGVSHSGGGGGRGTPFYAAPEVVGRGEVHKAGDVYSFGVMMWELISGTTVYVSQCVSSTRMHLYRVCNHVVGLPRASLWRNRSTAGARALSGGCSRLPPDRAQPLASTRTSLHGQACQCNTCMQELLTAAPSPGGRQPTPHAALRRVGGQHAAVRRRLRRVVLVGGEPGVPGGGRVAAGGIRGGDVRLPRGRPRPPPDVPGSAHGAGARRRGGG